MLDESVRVAEDPLARTVCVCVCVCVWEGGESRVGTFWRASLGIDMVQYLAIS